MIFTSERFLPIKEKEERYLFLAGSMDINLETNWRLKVSQQLGCTYKILDPTNKNHDSLNGKEMEKHIQWELDALNMADKILLNFLPNALSPISLVELGLYVSSGKLLVVCPKEFYKEKYVKTLCKKYKTPVFLTIKEALKQF